MSTPRTSATLHRRSDSSASRHAAGISTPFPITTTKFEYPDHMNNVPTSPVQQSSARERREFAASLQRALRNIRSPFTVNKTPKVPPSLLARRRGQSSTNITSASSSSLSSGNNPEVSPKRFSFIDLRRKSEEFDRVGVTMMSYSPLSRDYHSHSY